MGSWLGDRNQLVQKRVPSELRRPREETAGAGNVLDTGRQKLGYEAAETLNLPLTGAYGRSRMINEMCCGSGNHTDVEVCEHLAPPAGVGLGRFRKCKPNPDFILVIPSPGGTLAIHLTSPCLA